MNLLSDILVKNSLIFKKIKEIDFSSISKAKSLKIYYAIDLQGYCSLIILRNAKSRFANKNLQSLEIILEYIFSSFEENFTKKYFFISSPFCSKSKKKLQEQGFVIYDFM